MGPHRLPEAPRELPFQDTPGSRGQGYLAHWSHWSRQALSVRKAHGESLTQVGLPSVALGAWSQALPGRRDLLDHT